MLGVGDYRTGAALTPLPLLLGDYLSEIGCRLPGNHGNILGSGEVDGADAVVNGPDPVEGNAYLTAPCGSQLPPDIGSKSDRNPILFNQRKAACKGVRSRLTTRTRRTEYV